MHVAAVAGTSEEITIQVLCLNGEGCAVTLSGSTLGHEVRRMVLQRLPSKKGRKSVIHYKNSPLVLDQSLQEQGIVGKTAALACTFVPTDLPAAVSYISGFDVLQQEGALEGLTTIVIECATSGIYMQHLPNSLKTIVLDMTFNKTLERVNLPSGLQSLTFGHQFNQSLDGVSLPSGLQSLTFGYEFNQSLDGVSLPSGLQSLTFGYQFNHSLDRVSLSSGLQNLTLGYQFN